jgi:pentatricopeptide repeat protein
MNYAYALINGLGIEKNVKKACKYFKLCVDQSGDQHAVFGLALCSEGSGLLG